MRSLWQRLELLTAEVHNHFILSFPSLWTTSPWLQRHWFPIAPSEPRTTACHKNWLQLISSFTVLFLRVLNFFFFFFFLFFLKPLSVHSNRPLKRHNETWLLAAVSLQSRKASIPFECAGCRIAKLVLEWHRHAWLVSQDSPTLSRFLASRRLSWSAVPSVWGRPSSGCLGTTGRREFLMPVPVGAGGRGVALWGITVHHCRQFCFMGMGENLFQAGIVLWLCEGLRMQI